MLMMRRFFLFLFLFSYFEKGLSFIVVPSVTGERSNTETGNAVSIGGDVNGDGKGDILIGAYGFNSWTGKVYLIYGGQTDFSNITLGSISASQGIVFTGEGTNCYTGYSVSTGGDVSGDGKADMLIGAYGYNSKKGRVYLIYGSSSLSSMALSSLTSTQGIVISGDTLNSDTGYAVSISGDVNGDGKADLLIGAPGDSPVGRVFLIYGSSSLANIDLYLLTSSQGIVITGEGTNYFTGGSVSIGGDVNGDGKADILIGAPVYNSNTGKAYLIFGKSSFSNIALASLTSSQGVILTGTGTSNSAGYSVSIGGDVNGDGKADILIGAPGYLSNTGKVYLILGKSSSWSNSLIQSIAASEITGESTGSGTGLTVSIGGDANGDGKADILIGGYSYGNYMGIVYMLFGATTWSSIALSSLTSTLGIRITGEAPFYGTGAAVSMNGDVNGDGKADLLFSAQYFSNGRGKVYLVYGSTSMTNIDMTLPLPTGQPSRQPTGQPSRQPAALPTSQPTRQPSSQPSRQPSRQPSARPSRQPFGRPSSQPSRIPSAQPTSQPSRDPSGQPSRRPSNQPTSQPSRQPSSQPSRQPSTQPSAQPSRQPSSQPIGIPTSSPTRTTRPSFRPTSQPSRQPSGQPTEHPTSQPNSMPTCAPMGVPTCSPTSNPSTEPSFHPSARPVAYPSSVPTIFPTSTPSTQPSGAPSAFPSTNPTIRPTSQPNGYPTSLPSTVPSTQPSCYPSSSPTIPPTIIPTGQPSLRPSGFPSNHPTCCPSVFPSAVPSTIPSLSPSSLPTGQPSILSSSEPSGYPSCQPSAEPTNSPTARPSTSPTCTPSRVPSGLPSAQPSGRPIVFPSSQPTRFPSCQPSAEPTNSPTARPSTSPTCIPSRDPSGLPSAQPSGRPIVFPSSQPTRFPSCQPSAEPTNSPTSVPTEASMPTSIPSNSMNSQSTAYPSAQISHIPRIPPSELPSICPSISHTSQPNGRPSRFPSSQPSQRASFIPSGRPSSGTSSSPSDPSTKPTCTVTKHPNIIPSPVPSSQPSSNRADALMIESVVRIRSPTVFEFSFTNNEVSIQFTNPGIYLTSPTTVTLTLFPLTFRNSQNTSIITGRLIPDRFILPINSDFQSFSLTAGFVAGSPSVYFLNVEINSTNHHVNYATSRQLEVLSINTEPTVPKLESARFVDDGSSIVVGFDSATNMNDEESHIEFSCSSLFLFAGINVSSCYWYDDRTIQIYQETTNADDLLLLNDILTLKSSPLLKAKCPINRECRTWSSVEEQSITIKPPSIIALPKIEISAPLIISPCQPLKIDLTSSTGNGGRNWSNFTILARPIPSIPIEVIDSLNQFLQVNYTFWSPPSIPSSFFRKLIGLAVSFDIELCNFLTACNLAIYSVNISSREDLLIPAVSIAGLQSISMYTSYPMSMKSVVSTATCQQNASSYNLAFDWSIISEKPNEMIPKRISDYFLLQTTSEIHLPRYFLTPGNTYFLQVKVISRLSGVVSKSNQIGITVKIGNLIPIIRGGNMLVIEFNKMGLIDASDSYDEDVNSLTASTELTFEWICLPAMIQKVNNCSSFFHFPVGMRVSQLALIPWNIQTINSSFVLLLHINDRRTGRVASMSATLSVTTDLLNKLTIVTSQSSMRNVPTSSSLTVQAVMDIFRACTAMWSGNPLVSLNSVTALTTSVVQTFSVGKDHSFNLKIRPNVLPERSTIILSLTCGEQSVTSITVTTNSAPIPGKLEISPLQGFELLIHFTFSAILWMDFDLPLSYQFGFISPSTDSTLVTFIRSSLTSAQTVLPAGSNAHGNMLNCSLQVFDILNASKTMYTSVKVFPLTGDTKEIAVADYIVESTTSVRFQNDLNEQRTFVGVTSTVLNYVNCTVPVHCFSLYRRPCRLTSNTCGACLPGYHGDSGDRNTPCDPILSFENLTRPSTLPKLSGHCQVDSDCNLKVQYCHPVSKNCTFFQRRCTLDCSSQGTCTYRYIRTGLPLATCSIADLTCEAICSCDSGFVGLDCSVNQTLLPMFQDSHSLLIHALDNLTINDHPNPQTVESWSNALNSIVINPWYIRASDISTVQAIALRTIASGRNVEIPFDKLVGVLNTINNIATLTAFLAADRNLTSIPQTKGLLTVLTEYNRLILKDTVYGEPSVNILYDNFRMVNVVDVAPSSSSLLNRTENNTQTIVIPSTDIENILSVKKSSLQFLSSENDTNDNDFNGATFYSASLIETYEKSYTSIPDVFYSDPLALTLTTIPFSSNISILKQRMLYTIRHNEAFDRFPDDQLLSFFNATYERFISNCTIDVVNSTSFYCSTVPKVLEHHCNGSFEGIMVSYCPIIRPNCNVLNVSSSLLVSNVSRVCEVIEFTREQTVCSCLIQPALSSNISFHRRKLSIDTKANGNFISSGESVVTATEFVGDDFIHTFSVRNELNSPEGARKSSIMMGLIIVVWGGGFMIFFLFDILIKAKGDFPKSKTAKNGKQNAYHGKYDTDQFQNEEDFIQKIKQEILLYINLLIPAVYNAKETFLERCLTEMKIHHRYFHIFSLFSSSVSSFHRIQRLVKVLSIQTLQMFVQALLFDLQNPEDDGTCPSNYSREKCLERKTVMDNHQSYCNWSATSNQCSYATPQFSENAVIYVMVITAISTAIFKLPLDYCLKIWISPNYERKDFHQDSSLPKKPSQVLPTQMENSELHYPAEEGDKSNSMWSFPFLGCSPFFLFPLTFLCSCIPAIRRWRPKKSEGRNLPTPILRSHSVVGSFLARSELMELLVQIHYHHHLNNVGERVFTDIERGTDDYMMYKGITPLTREFYMVKRLCEQILQFRIKLKANLIQESGKGTNYVKSPQQILQEDVRWRMYNDQWGILPNPGRRIVEAHRILNEKTNEDALDELSPDDEDEDDDDDEDGESEDDYEENDSVLEEMVLQSISSPHSTLILSAFEEDAIQQFLSTIKELANDYQSQSLKLGRLTDINCSIELMFLFIVDVLGKHTAAARIFRNKFNEDYPTMFLVTRIYKILMILVIFLLNGFFVYFLLLKSISKGIAWQWQFLQVNAISLVIEIFLYETVECIFLNYFIPESVTMEVNNAVHTLQLISDNLDHFFLQQKHDLDRKDLDVNADKFDASTYFFVSKALIPSQPRLIESFIINSFQNHYPGMICFTWKHYQNRLAAYRREEIMKEKTRKQLLYHHERGDKKKHQVHDSLAVSRATRNQRQLRGGLHQKHQNVVSPPLSFSQLIEERWNWLKNSSFLMLTTITAGIFYTFQVIGLMPMVSQRMIIRLCQTSILSGLTILYYLPQQRKKPYFLVIVLLLSILILGWILRVIYRHRRGTGDILIGKGGNTSKEKRWHGFHVTEILRNRIEHLKDRIPRNHSDDSADRSVVLPDHNIPKDEQAIGTDHYHHVNNSPAIGIFDTLTLELEQELLERDLSPLPQDQQSRDYEEELKSLDDHSHSIASEVIPQTSALSSIAPAAVTDNVKKQELIHRVTAGDVALLFEMITDQRSEENFSTPNTFPMKPLVEMMIEDNTMIHKQDEFQSPPPLLGTSSFSQLNGPGTLTTTPADGDDQSQQSKNSRNHNKKSSRKSHRKKKKYQVSPHDDSAYNLEDDDDLQSVLSYSSSVKPSQSSAILPLQRQKMSRKTPSQSQIEIHRRLESLLSDQNESDK